MKSNILLESSLRCQVFETIASKIWDYTIFNHEVDISVPELGITNFIIAEIRNNFKSCPNIGLWSNPGHKESKHGCDIDIFVETKNGEYVWWALQAKVLKLNGKYSNLDHISNNEYQWQKLNKLSLRAGCYTRYLFYNGKYSYKYSGYDKCKNGYNQKQFGCSLIKTNTVKRLTLLNNTTFNDFHPNHAEPWRIITCCLSNTKGNRITIYFPDQIKEAVRYYEASAGNTDMILFNDNVESMDHSNAIDQHCETINRTPKIRVVIRTTDSLNYS